MSAKSLIIVESPTKARTISKFLGNNFEVFSSMGHIRDLPKSKIGVDVERDFEPKYVIPVKAKPVVAQLKAKAKTAKRIILATDEDREGEAISWHLVQALGLGDKEEIENGGKDKRISRIVFHEITKSAIEKALLAPRDLDLNLVDAQQARRILDRLVGYELSPFLWRKIRFGLSAGRVQSVAVRLVVEREREIRDFKQEEYWSIEALLETGKNEPAFLAKLAKVDGKPLEKLEIASQKSAEEILRQLNGARYTVLEVAKKQVQRHPSPPFTTSTLQQEASRKLGFSAKQTMLLSQQLYEGVELGQKGSQGLITYMRTDSVNLAESALLQAGEIIRQNFGSQYALASPRRFKTKSKGAQEAHEAIRPTDFSILPKEAAGFLNRNQARLYELIWKRAIACQMQPAEIEQTSADIAANGAVKREFIFRAAGQIVKFDGFIRAYTEGRDEDGEEEGENAMPELSKGQKLDLKKITPLQHFTQAPPRYTDATLIKALEAHGIGRPSTYAPTLSTIQDREYVEKIEKKFHPTEIGALVNDLLVTNFPEIVDINFTSHIEEELDDIAEGKIKWVEIMREFYGPFKKHLIEKEATVEKQVETTDTPCPTCGKMMEIKYGRMGKFMACSDPECKTTMPLPEEAAKIKELTEKTQGEKCPLCGGPMEVKRGRFGYFLGCTRYPECKGISRIWNKTGFKCPACLESSERKDKPGDVVERKSRGRGKAFYGCTRFPDCTFITNTKPQSAEDIEKVLKHWKENPPKIKTAVKKKKTG